MVKKMTMEEFVRNNRGINASGDLPRDYLESIFTSISENEIRMLSSNEARALTPPPPPKSTNLTHGSLVEF